MRYIRYFINIVFIIVAFFVISKEFRDTYYNIPLLFKEANKSLLFFLFLFQGLNYIGDGWLSQTLLAIAGFKIRLKDTLKIAILGVIGNHVAPFVGGTIVTYHSYKKLEIPSAVISFLVSAWTIFIWLTYVLFFLLSLLFLPNLFFNFVSPKIIFAVLVGLISISSIIFILSRKGGKYIVWFLSIFSKLINKIAKFSHIKNLFTPRLFKKFISDLYQYFVFLLKSKNKIPQVLFSSLLFYVGDILTFYFSFLVLGFQPNFALLIFGYSISLVLTVFTLMPGAPGIMEASLIVIFIKLGFPAHVVLFASLLFRLFSYWLPLPIGVFSYWRLKKVTEAK